MEEYTYLWTTEKDKWVLVNTEFGYGIVNKIEQTALLVTDDELEQCLIDRMIAEGCQTYDNINDAYADV